VIRIIAGLGLKALIDGVGLGDNGISLGLTLGENEIDADGDAIDMLGDRLMLVLKLILGDRLIDVLGLAVLGDGLSEILTLVDGEAALIEGD
jgi:hypothetical protein